MVYPHPDGVRPSDGRTINMTKQATNYLLGQLEALAIERRAQKGSNRRLVYLTAAVGSRSTYIVQPYGSRGAVGQSDRAEAVQRFQGDACTIDRARHEFADELGRSTHGEGEANVTSPITKFCCAAEFGRYRGILLKKSVDVLDPIFSASLARFHNEDAEGLVARRRRDVHRSQWNCEASYSRS